MKSLSQKEVKNVILKFFEMNANRAPISDFVSILDVENFEIGVAGTDIQFHGIAGFADHQIGKLIFFDQQFDIKSLKINIKKDKATVKTNIIWIARRWEFPAARSELLKAVVHQTWEVIRSPHTLLPIITSHIANKFYYLKGFKPHEQQKKEFHLTIGLNK